MKLTFNLVICLVSLITMAGYFVPYADPAVYPSMPFLGLAIPVLLILCALFIIWLIFKRQFIWLLFPILAIAANYRYLNGMFQYSSPASAARQNDENYDAECGSRPSGSASDPGRHPAAYPRRRSRYHLFSGVQQHQGNARAWTLFSVPIRTRSNRTEATVNCSWPYSANIRSRTGR